MCSPAWVVKKALNGRGDPTSRTECNLSIAPCAKKLKWSTAQVECFGYRYIHLRQTSAAIGQGAPTNGDQAKKYRTGEWDIGWPDQIGRTANTYLMIMDDIMTSHTGAWTLL